MSDTAREPDATLGGQAVDQGARAVVVEDRESDEDVVETLRRQLEELEGAGAEKDKAREATERRAADAERRAADAEARARQADQQARQVSQDSQRSTAEAQLDAVKNALDSHKGAMTGFKAAYAAAMTEGDFTKAADVQAEMAVAGGKIVQLEAGRDALELRVKEPPPADDTTTAQPSESERKESYIRTMPAKVQDWLRGPNGDRYFTDRAFQQKVASAAAYASNNKGIAPDSDQYIEFIETEVGLRQAQAAPANNQQQAATGRTADDRRMTTAPAGGSTGGAVRSNADGSTSVYLSAGEKEMARRMELTDAEYARHKKQLLDEGLIGPGARGR